jgi:hypothetical protein
VLRYMIGKYFIGHMPLHVEHVWICIPFMSNDQIPDPVAQHSIPPVFTVYSHASSRGSTDQVDTRA